MTRAHMWLRKAQRAKANGDLAKASGTLERILTLPFPDSADTRRFLGPVACNLVVLLKEQGKWRDAEGAAVKGLARIEHAGTPVTYHVMLLHSLHGEVLEQLGRSKEASDAYQRAEQLELELEAEN
jgi:tetratricopeptide (TPR) repeat protein